MLFDPDHYVSALRFAARAHGSQLEPSGLPYIVHVTSVASEVIVSLAADPLPPQRAAVAVQCALLHDTVEDTAVQLAEIEASFGAEVAAGVDALSKRPHLPKDQQMGDSLDRILLLSEEIARVKLADRIINLREPPSYWSAEKRVAYRAEAGVILARLGERNTFLADRLQTRIADYGRYLL